jgi:hypothetical protein
METIFTIDVISGLNIEEDETLNRCVGYFKTLEKAETELKTNSEEIYSCEYEYGIIEEFTEGLYQEPKSVYYYKFNKEMRVYEKIDEPKEWKEIGNFAIG